MPKRTGCEGSETVFLLIPTLWHVLLVAVLLVRACDVVGAVLLVSTCVAFLVVAVLVVAFLVGTCVAFLVVAFLVGTCIAVLVGAVLVGTCVAFLVFGAGIFCLQFSKFCLKESLVLRVLWCARYQRWALHRLECGTEVM